MKNPAAQDARTAGLLLKTGAPEQFRAEVAVVATEQQ
jgi:hypothetical protein